MCRVLVATWAASVCWLAWAIWRAPVLDIEGDV